jgi:hypothetical protein
MAITRPARPKSTEDFISGAPDAAASKVRKGVTRGKKEQITLTIAPDMLTKVDTLAERMGQSRAAVINMAIFRLVSAEG